MNFRHTCTAVVAASFFTFSALACGPAFLAAPPAHAQAASTHRAATAGTMDWGIRESFRKYVETGVAKGSISTDGGATRSGSGFSFPLESAAISSSTSGQINFSGEVHFYGHNGALDMTLRNPIIVVNGTQAELRVDYASRKYEGMDKTGGFREGRQEVLAAIALNQSPDFAAAQTTIAGSVSLTASGAEIFGGFYEAGEQLDPISIGLSLHDASGPAPTPQYSLGAPSGGQTGKSPEGGTGATRSKATSGPASLLGDINDTLIEVNGLLVNTDNVLKNGENLYNRVNPAAQALQAQQAPQAQQAGQAGQAGQTKQAQQAGSAAGDACSAPASKGVTSAEATWGVRQSFRTYIRGNIAKGAWELTGVGDNGTSFTFNGNAGAVDPSTRTGTVLLPGSIRFTGHNGVLDTRFSNLEIQFSGNTGQLVLNAASNSTEGTRNDYGRVAIANLSFTDLNISETAASGTATTTLTDVGAEAFGQFYPPGDPLDPISFTAQLGGSANCADGQGGSNSAAATGKGGSSNSAEKLRSSGGTGGSAANTTASTTANTASGTSVLDDVQGAETVVSAEQPQGGQFQIKNVSGADAGSGWDDAALAKFLLLAASMIGAGGALTRFAITA
ncbi:HtaA domain-containing protein [Corynebacterium sp. HMSC30G07]|uniref:HtaA domain-containing protein n=1 Tax=Corynebacterium sp. HMSC30G07 TaxID=1581072 RepID=UPI0009F2F7FF|nr:HtaA domain-containing protein [Corynebacterium sp. HMSC30G07]